MRKIEKLALQIVETGLQLWIEVFANLTIHSVAKLIANLVAKLYHNCCVTFTFSYANQELQTCIVKPFAISILVS